MKFRIHKIAVAMGTALLSVAVSAQEATPALPTAKDKVSYSVGVDIARNFRKHEVDFDPDVLMRGIKDALSDSKLLLPEKEVRRVLNGFQAEVRRKMAQDRKIAAEENRRKGVNFLAENKLKDGVISLASGVQYRVVKASTGPKPTEADTVTCNYRGTLLSGVEFDATIEGKPAQLKMSQVIPGWRDALRNMPVGSKWQIFVPHTMAYGERGVGTEIGPNETLVFDVELLSIK